MRRIACSSAILTLLFFSFVRASDFQIINLSHDFNNDGISSDANRADGNFDVIGDYSPGSFNLASEELPPSNSIITTFGIPFQFPDKTDGVKNNILCKGETISISSTTCSALYLLGNSANGSYEEPLLLIYSDQSIETTKLSLSDWCAKPQYGEVPAITASFRQTKTGNREPKENHIWLQEIDINTTKELTGIQLPNSQSLHIFALTLGTGDKIDLSKIPLPQKTSTEDNKMFISFKSTRPGNIFLSGDTALIKITVGNIPDTVKKMYLRWQVLDINKKVISQKEEFLTRWENGGFIFPISIPYTSNGWYQLQVTLRNEKESLPIGKTNFAWVTPSLSNGNDPNSKVGMGLSFENLSNDELDKSGQLAQLAGIKWVRQEFSWGKIQPHPDKWVWKDYDNAVESAKRYHLETLGLLDYWTGWSKPYTQDGYKQYAQFVSEVVNRYKDKIKYWEIWNEPNIGYWKGTLEQYTELLKTAYRAAKDADPQCKIIACATFGVDTSFITKVFNAGGFNFMDGISVHPYRDAYPDQNNLAEDLSQAKELIAKQGGGKELWLTEIGWWTSPTGKSGGVTGPVQASSLVRSYIISCYSGLADKIFWYTWRNPGTNTEYSEDNFGVLTHDVIPKPSYVALANMTRQLNGYDFISTLNLGNNCAVYLFQKENQKLIVAWNKSGSMTVGIQSDANSLKVTDLFGNTNALLPMGKVVTITLTDMPVYISGSITDIKGLARIIDLNLPDSQVHQGQKLNMGIQLNNIFSKDLIGNIAVKVSDAINQNILGDEPDNTVTVKPGEQKEWQYKMDISDSATIGLTPIEVLLDTKSGGMFKLQTEFKILKKKPVHSEDTTQNNTLSKDTED